MSIEALEKLLSMSTKNYTPLEAAVVFLSGTHAGDSHNAAAELEALREIARLATVIRTRYPGLLAVMWENDAEGSRKLPYMREKLDAALAALTQKGTTK